MSKARELAELGAVYDSGALSNRNVIINGAMQVAQRGASVAVSDGSNEGYQSLDRFALYFSNSAGGACTISQDTTVPSGYGFSNSYKVDVTTADTSISSTHAILIQHSVEAQNIRNSGWDYTSTSSYITLSFWARSVKAGIYNVVFAAADVGHKYYPVEYTLVANTWKKITITVPGDSSLVFNNDTGAGLNIRWNLQSGSDRNQGTANQWNATNVVNQGTSNQVNFFDSTSNDFYLTGVQLEVGTEATPFEHRSFGQELALCQRYFCKIENNTGGLKYWGILQAYNANNVFGVLKEFPAEMRTTPTGAQSGNFGGYSASSSNASLATTIGGLAITSRAWISTGWGTSSSLVAGYAVVTYWENGAFLTADAEL